ncbi:hypothetical protein H072_2555 [Dactylellina haptotyla CBS 200.50]|uniref:Uncharacterized protein n=1 Tax=Dactylellina haptotyla (strain CBS 200.50) TaxID=1284197 RepID=S8AKL7_DACHA|nr:hypothetical protein H072_2555 [Dactylellina haptotyla CBS 200.50]
MALSNHQPSSNLNPLPDRWQPGTEETQRSFLQAKSDEEKRRQEEERTKQEGFRLEIRKTELEILREAFRGGVPPHLVPVIFTGGGGLSGMSAEWVNHYISQLNHNQQQLLQGNIVSPPDSRLESRLLTATEHQTPRSGALSSVSHTPAQSQSTPHLPTGPAHSFHSNATTYAPFNPPGLLSSRGHSQQIHTSEPPKSSLPRINTNEIHTQSPQQAPLVLNMQLSGIPSHPQSLSQNTIPHQASQSHLAQPQTSQEPHRHQTESSPIFFHHWQPPSSQPPASGPAASTSPASGKNVESSPFSNQPYVPGHESSNSPKKRKFTITPGPTANPQVTAFSSFSPGSSGGANKRRGTGSTHSRHRSDSGSARGYEPYPKHSTARPRRSDTDAAIGENGGSGHTNQFSISHMTGHNGPESHREFMKTPQNGPTPHESPVSHSNFQAGPDSRVDHSHGERENSTNHGHNRN